MTSQGLLIIAGVVLSLLFSYIPPFASWYNPLDDTKKRLIMLVLLIVITGAVFGLSCGGIISNGVTCDKPGAMGLITALVFAIVANQGTNSLSPKIGLKSPVSKDVILTNESGATTTVGMTQLGTTADVEPDAPSVK